MGDPTQNYINHIALVLDESSSMWSHRDEVIKVADAQIAYLAQRSKEMDQETRITVYTFANSAKCVIYDKDVLRLPSIRQYYSPNGMTALLDATDLALDDLGHIWEGYGDHAFLAFVLTDGQENASRRRNIHLSMATRLRGLPSHWTVAVLVPDALSKHEAKKFGFPDDNIAIWDTTSTRGMAEAGETIRRATDNFMDGRAKGVRGSRSIFSTGADAVNDQTVKTTLTPLSTVDYLMIPVDRQIAIRDFVLLNGINWRTGQNYYELMKREEIQATKKILVVERATGRVYGGSAARDLLGLPDLSVKVTPDHNPKYTVFVQSTSVNRKLLPGTKLIVLT
jgi:hypothetical protein